MQNAETVLNVIRERGERGLPLENIYRLLYNRNLYLRAYGRIYSNQGATTKGVTAETVDGMSLAKIDRIIDALRYERFRWTPVRRVNIPKPNNPRHQPGGAVPRLRTREPTGQRPVRPYRSAQDQWPNRIAGSRRRHRATLIPSQKGLFEMNPGVRRGLEGRSPRDAGCWPHRTICRAQDKRDPDAVPLPWLRAPGGSCGAAPSCGRDRRYRPDRPLSRVLHLHQACMDHPLEVARQRLQVDGKPHPTAPSHPQAPKPVGALELGVRSLDPGPYGIPLAYRLRHSSVASALRRRSMFTFTRSALRT